MQKSVHDIGGVFRGYFELFLSLRRGIREGRFCLLVGRYLELRVKLPKRRRRKNDQPDVGVAAGVDEQTVKLCQGLRWDAVLRRGRARCRWAWRVLYAAGEGMGWMFGVRAPEEFMLWGQMDRKSAADRKSDGV